MLCLRCSKLFYNLFCVVVNSVVFVCGCRLFFIVSVCCRLLSVVLKGCSLFRLFQALAHYFRLSRIFELFKIVLRRPDYLSSVVLDHLGCVNCLQIVHVVQSVLDSRRWSRLV